MKHRPAILATLKQCRIHAQVMHEALDELGDTRFDENTVTRIGIQERRLLDQLAYRFSKLQDRMGMKLLPMLLDRAEEPLPQDATFAEKLQRLERLGVLESVERWRELREIRHQLAHEYVDAPALKAAVLNRFIKGAGALLHIWRKAEAFAKRHEDE